MHPLVRLFAVAIISVVSAPFCATAGTENPATIVERESRAFTDASANDDIPVLARLLDEHVVFINENGEVATKADLLAPSPTPPTAANRVVQTKFSVRFHGNVAVTTFTDVATSSFHGHPIVRSFLSTESWLDEAGAWKMIQSQTLALETPPPPVALPPSTLDGYVGRYRASSDFVIEIAHAGDQITATAPGGKPVALVAEVRDLFYVAGQRGSSRRLFLRDASGAITAYVIRIAGHDIVLPRVTS